MIQYNVRFFKPEEFKCPCCGQGSPAQMLVLWLDLFRAAWGGPVRINSGFRCEKHNKEVGGAEKSRHLISCAADIAPVTTVYPGRSMPDFKATAKRMFALPGWEVIEYTWGMHVAVPREEEERKWGPVGRRQTGASCAVAGTKASLPVGSPLSGGEPILL